MKRIRIGDLNLRQKLIGQGLIPIILLVGLASLALYSVGLLLKSVHDVDHTHKVIRQALEAQEHAVQMQTGMRGFLLTGEDKFLEEFVQGEKKIADELGSLRKTVGDVAPAKMIEEAEGIILSWKGRGRDISCLMPPAQIRTCGITAYGSYLGWMA